MNTFIKMVSLLLLTISFNRQVNSANILIVGVVPTYSHFAAIIPLIKELIAKNHKITFIEAYQKNFTMANCTHIFVETIREFFEERHANITFSEEKFEPQERLSMEFSLGLSITERVLNNSRVQKLLNSQETFDAVIIEHFSNEAIFGIAHHFKSPIILLSLLGPNFKNNYLVANPAPSSYVPNIWTSFTKHMTFWERLKNFIINSRAEIIKETFLLQKGRELFKKYLNSSVELDDVVYNVSLILTNSHVSSHDAVPQVPNMINIGGYHIDSPKKLPQDLQHFLDTAEDGVILFSLGSVLKSRNLATEVQKTILNVFSKMKQKVLWKFESDLTDLPKNVKIMKWLPLQDVLAHPNIRVIIQHCGVLSLTEAVYFGVPVIGIPVFADQDYNMRRAVLNGYALSLSVSELTEEKFSSTLNEILHNPIYRENAQKRSKLMRDQPMKPLDTAIYWIEHVIRYQGAPHLRSAGLDLKWYQRENIDIFVFLLLVVITLPVTAYVLLKTLVKAAKYKKYDKLIALEANKRKIQ